ncbi:heme peroxidase [Leptodontidium sp. 2 PMI_412]|nr:heme peroxidase [Leptodontidium sp. 2 PMI_412]
MYLNYLFYEVRLFTSTYTDLLLAVATFAFYTGVALAIWSWWIQEGSFSGFKSGASSLAVKVVRYIPERVGIILPKDALEEKYDVDGAYGDPKALTTGLLQDLKHAGIRGVRKNVFTLLQVAMQKGKPVDDKLMTMEKLIAITALLPPNSKSRKRLSHTIVRTLWDSLDHPPRSYLGEKFQYRMADGSYNNILVPHLGQAGTPYARTSRATKRLHGVRPDPGLLFDLLMSRDDKSFKENPAGISSVLFYHATIIVHDIFRTNRKDANISDTSSYLDLAPLYGSSLEDQLKVRTMSCGLLKPDTFHEKRLLAQPPGINVMLIMYNRFHNYVADVLLKINENGRFTLPHTRTDEDKKKALAKQDNDLFQTARLIVGGLYINICLHDYLRGLTNTHHSSTTWTLDPRVEITKQYDGEDLERGCGNQVSAEFNLLYRFHSIISKRDEKWLEKFLNSILPDKTKHISELSPAEFFQAFLKYEASIDPDPSKREFDGLKRGPDGRFQDEDLVNIMTSAMEDPAGLFGSKMVPKALRVVEILGILQARKWGMASLNEFRHFFGLKKHETMEEINPDPEIAALLRNLYDHPDMVELYPGLFVEDAKPRMDPGCGGCPPYTVGRAVFSDAVVLVRSDRFYTIDYTAANLTNWGMQEVQQNYKVLGGSMFYRLFQRSFPGWYPYNSLHIMQPMFTWKMNKQIAEELSTIKLYSVKGPKKPTAPIVLTKHSTIVQVLKDQTSFRVPWLPALNDLFPGKTDYSAFMLSGDGAGNAKQRALLQSIMYGPDEFTKLVSEFVTATAKKYLELEGFKMNAENLCQIDIIRDIAIPACSRLIGDLFYLDLHGPQNPHGTLTTKDLYKHLLNVRVWGFNNNDPGLAFIRRILAQEGATVLTKTTQASVKEATTNGMYTTARNILKRRRNHINLGSLRWYGQRIVRQLSANGLSCDEVAEIMWLTGVAGVGVPVSLFAEVLQFYLQPKNAELWDKIQDLVTSSGPTTDSVLKQYVLEAQRMVSTQRNLRVCESGTTIDGRKFSKGDTVICLLGPACKDADAVPDPQTFKLGRPSSAYMHFGHGVHECLGREIALTYCVALLKIVASLKNLRPAPGEMGTLKAVTIGTERCYLDDTWSNLTFDPTTWKLHYEGFGKGTWKPKAVPEKPSEEPKKVEAPKQNTTAPIPVSPDADGQWHWIPSSKSGSDSGSPQGKPPPLPPVSIQPQPQQQPQPQPQSQPQPQGPPSVTSPPVSQPVQPKPQSEHINGTYQLIYPQAPSASSSPPPPKDLSGLDDIFSCEVDWFYVAASYRDPTARMPEEIRPPPMPASSSESSLSQSWQTIQISIPGDLAHIDDVLQVDCTWYWGPESGRDADIPMPNEYKPPPIPVPGTATTVSANDPSTTSAAEPPRTNRERRQSSRSGSSSEVWQDSQVSGVKRKDMK